MDPIKPPQFVDKKSPSLWDAVWQYIKDASPGGSLNQEWTPSRVENAKQALSFTPVIGDAISGYDAINAARQGNWGEAAINAVGLLPFVPGITAWHGSPHLFEKFSKSKIGTGEGSAAYGHGMYFAENPEVAKTYQGVAGTKGNLYKVDIPDEKISQMIDWDKRIKDQEIYRSGALREIADDAGLPASYTKAALIGDKTGEDFYSALSSVFKSDRRASEYLSSWGVPGLKYDDLLTREGKSKTKNFVVFGEDDVKMLGRE